MTTYFMDNFVVRFASDFTHAISAIKINLPLSVSFIALLFGIQFLNWLTKYRLNILGIWPRKLIGIPGIFCSSFLHGSLGHLIFNSLPLFIFASMILMYGAHIFYMITLAIILISGSLTWIFARPGIHVGASSLIMGYLGFLLYGIYFHENPLSLVVGVVCLYYFGGMITSIFPSENKEISFEGHFFGVVAGLAAAYYWG